ncbi:12852_t:CDS:2, partial [Entrophospora sp. SA101]
EDVLASKLDDTGETKQVNTFVPKEQSSANISDTVNASCRSNSDNTPKQIISQNENTPVSDISDIASNSGVCQKSKTHKSLEDEEIDEFLDTKRKERVSEEIIQIIKEKKLRDQEVSSRRQDTSPEKLISSPLPLNHNEKTGQILEISPLPEKSNLKIPYNRKVEQGLRHELSVCNKDNNKSNSGASAKTHKVFDIQIPDFPLETILTGSSKITSRNIVDLFRVAMKVRQKENLCWYCYYKAYENRVSDIKSANNSRASAKAHIDDQLARTIVYNEIKSLLPDITNTTDMSCQAQSAISSEIKVAGEIE